jgi:serine phosphatase RsbU (regulator of sigma subunit)/anti-sigma regulatory factor (Ser/Thr protein kinase)
LTELHGPAEGGQRYGPLTRSRVARYGGAALLSLAALVGARLLFPVVDVPLYSILVGAVAVAVWYGGFGPGVLTIAIGWSIAPFLLRAEGESAGFDDREEFLTWAAPLVVALVVVWVSVAMRRGQERAATAAVAAEESTREMETLQQLSAALSSALTPTDVAHALVDKTPSLLGARGGAIGLVDGDDLVIVDPAGVASQTHRPGLRLPLATRAPIARAAAEGSLMIARDREDLVARFPDGAALTPYAQAALAVPLRVAGDVVGSMSFLFDEPGSIDENSVSIAYIASDVGGQALERARLYDREQQSRRALDRILRVAPRFHAETSQETSAAVCEGARTTFGADLAEIWSVTDGTAELDWQEPPNHIVPAPGVAQIDAVPGLRNAVDELEVTFVGEVAVNRGSPLARHARGLGIQSLIWIPIVVGPQAERTLLLGWQSVISEPDASTVILARRFADQAGLAFEQLDRRLAQAEAARRAERTRRLQLVTAALSQAATASDVGSSCLEHAIAAAGADAGIIAFLAPSGDEVALVSSQGYDDEAVERWRTLPLDTKIPLTAAISSGQPIWALDDETAAPFLASAPSGGPDGERAWIALPMTGGAGSRGALQLGFKDLRELGDEDREWLQALTSQCSQAFERSRLLDEERRLRRRSEQLQRMTASLSGAVAQRDVADVVVAQIVEAVGAGAAGLAVLDEASGLVTTLSSQGYDQDVVQPLLNASLDAPTPGNRAIRRRATRIYETLVEIGAEFPEAARDLALTGHASVAFVPLLVGGRVVGLLVASWAERTTLSDEEQTFLESLAGQASQALERARHFESERTIAETLQRSVLPEALPRVEGAELAARYLPGTAELEVGGDWFDAIPLSNGRLGLVVGDVVGKGVQAAAMMAQLRNALRAFALDQMKPSSTVTRLNRLAEELSDSTFATLVYVVVDPVAHVCRFTSAGHPPPLVLYPEGRAEFLEGGRGLPLGTVADTSYTQDVVQIPVGTTLVLYTDGLIERRGSTIDEGLELLRVTALEGLGDPDGLVEHILSELVGLDERRDDIALLAVRLLGTASMPLQLRLPSTVDSLDLVRVAMREWLEGTPATRTEIEDIVLATWEACANAVEHADDPVEDMFSVDAELDQDSVRVTVVDSGSWRPATERSDRGLGLRLMHSLMSSVDLDTGADGTRIRLQKELAEPTKAEITPAT